MSAIARIFSAADLEIRIARRNRWAALASGLLTVLALSLALFASGQVGQVKADTLTLTAAGMATLSVYLIPLIALLLSYDAFAGEMERGTLALALATPLGRGELFLAKLLAQVTVVGGAILIAFTVAALTLMLMGPVSGSGLVAWGRLAATSLALGTVFVALGIAISAATPRVGMAAATAIAFWLVFVVLYDVALLGALFADGDGFFARHVFPWLMLANPADAYRLYNLVLLTDAPVAGIDGLARTLPAPPAVALATLALWTAAAIGAGVALTRRLKP